MSRSGIFLHISCDISSYKGSISMLALTISKENDKLCNYIQCKIKIQILILITGTHKQVHVCVDSVTLPSFHRSCNRLLFRSLSISNHVFLFQFCGRANKYKQININKQVLIFIHLCIKNAE